MNDHHGDGSYQRRRPRRHNQTRPEDRLRGPESTKRRSAEPSDRPTKSTRTADPEQVPVPEAQDDELYIEDVYMVKADDLPVGWRCVLW